MKYDFFQIKFNKIIILESEDDIYFIQKISERK